MDLDKLGETFIEDDVLRMNCMLFMLLNKHQRANNRWINFAQSQGACLSWGSNSRVLMGRTRDVLCVTTFKVEHANAAALQIHHVQLFINYCPIKILKRNPLNGIEFYQYFILGENIIREIIKADFYFINKHINYSSFVDILHLYSISAKSSNTF